MPQETKPKPTPRKPSINDHFRREWLWHGAVWLILFVVTLLAGWLGPLWLGK